MMKPSKASHGPGRPPEHCFEDDLNILLAFARCGAVSGRRDLMEVLSLDKDSVNKALATLTEPSDVDAEAVFVVENAYAGRLRRIGDGSPLLAKRPRLTTEQANAYCEALDRLGIPRDDERRAALERAVYPKGYRHPVSIQERMTTDGELHALEVCAASIVRARGVQKEDSASDDRETRNKVRQPVVTFSYASKNRTGNRTSKQRHVVPLALRLFNGTWQVDAYDLDRKAARTFVARNMGDTELSEQTAVAIISSIDADDGNRVMITCADMDTAHELLALNEARLEETADGALHAWQLAPQASHPPHGFHILRGRENQPRHHRDSQEGPRARAETGLHLARCSMHVESYDGAARTCCPRGPAHHTLSLSGSRAMTPDSGQPCRHPTSTRSSSASS